ncbi:MAG: glycosyl hydrolase family 18 protein [Ferruginibacter sp.]
MRAFLPVKLSTLFISLFISSLTFSQFKVVGYVHPGKRQGPDLNKISFQRLTHLNIAFVNPDSAGNLVLPAGFDSLVQKAHEYHVKVLVSLGGGSHNPFIAGMINDTNRKLFVQQLVQLTADHNLDGIDVDLEGDAIDKHYDPFISDLSAGLKSMGKLLTAAFASWNAEIIPSSALEKFDFINVMSYDQTGPWRPNQPGPHATYIKAEEDLHYWTGTRGMPKNKVNLGLPFYGYCFGTKYGESMSYGDIVTSFPGADTTDIILPEGGGAIYLNGLNTIQRKTAMALQNAGGIMIWQLLQDAEGDKSLLLAIETIIKTAETP